MVAQIKWCGQFRIDARNAEMMRKIAQAQVTPFVRRVPFSRLGRNCAQNAGHIAQAGSHFLRYRSLTGHVLKRTNSSSKLVEMSDGLPALAPAILDVYNGR